MRPAGRGVARTAVNEAEERRARREARSETGLQRTLTLKKQDRDRLLAIEMKCYMRILRIKWEQEITNEEVRSRVRRMNNVVQQTGHGKEAKLVWTHMQDEEH